MSKSKKFTVPNKDKYICRDCDFTFFIGVKTLGRSGTPFCPSCGENMATEKSSVHRRHWTLKEIKLIDEIIEGNLTKYQVADLTKRTYFAVQRKFEIRMRERGLRKHVIRNEQKDIRSY